MMSSKISFFILLVLSFFQFFLFAQAQNTQPSESNAIQAVFVGNNKAGTVSVIEANTFTLLSTIDVIPDIEKQLSKRQKWLNRYVNKKLGPKYVDDLDILPDGETMVISRPYFADIAAFDLNTKELLWTIPLKQRPDHQVMTKDGKYLFVSMLVNKKGLKIDLEKQKIIGSYKTGRRPHSIVLNKDETLVYNGSLKGNDIVVVDTRSLKRVDKLSFPQGVRPFKLADDEKSLYAQLSYFHGIVHYDLEKQTIVKKVELPVPEFVEQIPRKEYPFEAAHHGIGISKDRKYMSVAGTISNYVAFLSFSELKLIKTLEAGI